MSGDAYSKLKRIKSRGISCEPRGNISIYYLVVLVHYTSPIDVLNPHVSKHMLIQT